MTALGSTEWFYKGNHYFVTSSSNDWQCSVFLGEECCTHYSVGYGLKELSNRDVPFLEKYSIRFLKLIECFVKVGEQVDYIGLDARWPLHIENQMTYWSRLLYPKNTYKYFVYNHSCIVLTLSCPGPRISQFLQCRNLRKHGQPCYHPWYLIELAIVESIVTCHFRNNLRMLFHYPFCLPLLVLHSLL